MLGNGPSQSAPRLRLEGCARLIRSVNCDDCDKASFKFNGTIEQVHVEYVTAKKAVTTHSG